MRMREAKPTFVNDVVCTLFYKNDKERIKIVTDLKRKQDIQRRQNISGIKQIEVDEKRGIILYSHAHEAGSFH